MYKHAVAVKKIIEIQTKIQIKILSVIFISRYSLIYQKIVEIQFKFYYNYFTKITI